MVGLSGMKGFNGLSRGSSFISMGLVLNWLSTETCFANIVVVVNNTNVAHRFGCLMCNDMIGQTSGSNAESAPHVSWTDVGK